ncbi:MAG: hypothetical protein J6W75_13030 [Bacteroidaceae bacterium]|nr:hypothetical protein [Bacteroidaceae bacterium]
MKLNKIFLMSLIAATGLAFTACSEDDEYTVGGGVGNINVTFADEENKTLALEDTEFTIKVQRADNKGELTVPIIVLHKPEVFTVPESVTFADGEDTKEITIAVSEKTEAFVDYILMLTFPKEYCAVTYKDIDATYLDTTIVDRVDEEGIVVKDEEGNVMRDTLIQEVPFIDPASTAYGYSTMQITVHKEDYKPWGSLTYFSWLFEDAWDSNVYYSEYLDLYRCDIFFDGYSYWFKYDAENHTIAFTDGAGVEKTDTYFGYVHSTYGDMFTRWLKENQYNEEEDVYYIPMAYRVSAGSFGDDYDAIQMHEGVFAEE